MNATPLLRVLGATMVFLAVSMLIPLMLAISQDDSVSKNAFSAGVCVSGFFGIVLFLTTRGRPFTIGRRETVALLPLLAVVATLIGGLPFYLCGNTETFLDASFEALSGITTTGLSLFPDPSVLSPSELLWRAMLQWIGGYGTLVLVIWALPSFGLGGVFMPRRDAVETLAADPQPSFHRLVRSLFVVYGSLTVMCATALLFAGMPLFDSICYSMSTLSTGGFVIESSGPLGFKGVGIHLILALFMMLGAINFTLHGRFISGDWGVYSREFECRILLIVILVAVVLILSFTGKNTSGSTIVSELLTLVSVLTTTGYPGTEMPDPFLKFFLLVFIFLAVVGGTTGSTSGGFKLMRLALLIRQAKRELVRLVHPHAVVPIKYGHFAVTQSFLQSLWVFFIGYIFCLAALAVTLSCLGIDFATAVISAVSALTNSGPALLHLSDLNVNFAIVSDGAKLTIMTGMLVGRLELLALLVLLNFSFWRP